MLGNLSDLAFGHDRYQDALGYLDRELDLARRTGDRPNEWFATSESTYALYQLGRWDEALEAFAQLPVELLPSGHTLISPLTAILPIHLYRGELERARELCEIYAPLASSIDVQERSCYSAGHATLALAEGRYDDALADAGDAVATQGLVGAWPQNVKLGLITAVEAALALGRRDRVDELLAAPESEPIGLRTPLIAAHAHRFRGRMAGSAESAVTHFTAGRGHPARHRHPVLAGGRAAGARRGAGRPRWRGRRPRLAWRPRGRRSCGSGRGRGWREPTPWRRRRCRPTLRPSRAAAARSGTPRPTA